MQVAFWLGRCHELAKDAKITILGDQRKFDTKLLTMNDFIPVTGMLLFVQIGSPVTFHIGYHSLLGFATGKTPRGQ